MKLRVTWLPAIILGVGALFTVGVDHQRSMPLRAALAESVPGEVVGRSGQDIELSEAEQRVAGMDDYLFRVFTDGEPAEQASLAPSVYVGYYERQTQGQTIHSPKNCLPGAGWQALDSREIQIATAAGAVAVNHYILQREDARAVVLYWYQGRGRVEPNEYRVKWDLLWDSATRGRSEEALVRVLVPVTGEGQQAAVDLAIRIAGEVVPSVYRALPS